ncbi:MAG: PilZ domain-containing protein, partial [Marinospirillum sp.]|uniref:HD domain-containing phosphohydrolase n=1 Tax=Marinospirillum sp. TaxID=2183934 RepID=UPI0019E3371F
MDKNKQQQQDERLTGTLLRRAMDTAIQQGGIKIQPLVRDDQTALDEPWPVTHLQFDREHGQIKVQLSGDEQQIGFLARWSLFRLYIKHRNLLYESDPLDVLHTALGAEKLQLTLVLPAYFSKVFHREFFRVYLESRVKIQARLHLPGLDLLGQLEDLSAGGCRMALPPQAALHLLQPFSETPKCSLIFPNGESVTTPFELTYLQPDEGFLHAQVGCHFAHESPDDERRFFHYTLEAEREIARLTNVQRVSKFPSRLFQRPEKKAEQAKRKTRHEQTDAELLMPTGYADIIQQLADQLALQVLRLSGLHKLDADRMKPLAMRLIELLDNNENAIRLALQLPNPGINSILLHTLRVATFCFPLAFKIGLARGQELQVMVSLLLHDLGKLFVSRQPCFNPQKQSHETLRQMKQNQIHLLRAAAKLHWISPSIGESLLVNANERLDGSGYPRGLEAEQLDPLSRMISVAKVLDCLVHCYHDPSMRWRDAYKWVYQHDEWFDKPMLKRFIKRYGLRPVGSRLVYKNGYLACVTQVDKHGEVLEVVLLQYLKNPNASIRGDRINRPEDLQALGAIHG